MKRAIILLVFVGCYSLSFNCAAADKAGNSSVIPQAALDEAGLQEVWQNELPLKDSEKIDRMFAEGDYLYVLTTCNYVFAINTQKGEVAFGKQMAAPKIAVYEPFPYEKEVVFVAANEIISIDPSSGAVTKNRKLDFNASGPAERNQRFIYVAGLDNRIHAINVADDLEAFQVAADNDPMITSFVVGQDYVVFATETGKVLGMAAEKAQKLWQFDAEGGISAPLAKEGSWIYASSRDTNLYKISAITGTLGWRYACGGVLFDSARVTKQVVYQYVRDREMVALDKESGKVIWQLTAGRELLAEADSKAYVIAVGGVLFVMDNKDGKQLKSVNFSPAMVFASNVNDSRMYVSTAAGRLACLEPAVAAAASEK